MLVEVSIILMLAFGDAIVKELEAGEGCLELESSWVCLVSLVFGDVWFSCWSYSFFVWVVSISEGETALLFGDIKHIPYFSKLWALRQW